jgi:phosphoglycolate phosphatase
MIRKRQLVLFDLDGVLLDSRGNMEAAWSAVRKACGIRVTFEDYFARIGRPFRDILDQLGLGERHAEIEPVFRTASMANLHSAPFFDGVEDTVRRLKDSGVKIGIVTSKDALRTSAILAKLPVEFDTVQTPNARLRGKPAPDHLLVAMAEARTDPAETVYLGDMDADCESAMRAGVDYVHTAWGYGRTPARCFAVLRSIRDLPPLIGL